MLPANRFGTVTANVTFSGIDASTSAAATNSPVVVPVSAFEIGFGTKATGDGSGVPGGTYGNLITTSSLASGASLAGLTTTLGTGATSFGIGKTTATILAGTLGASSTGLSETWRSRSAAESANSVTGFPTLVSDVVNLTGIAGGASSPYALQNDLRSEPDVRRHGCRCGR